jgi:hypothetical protein
MWLLWEESIMASYMVTYYVEGLTLRGVIADFEDSNVKGRIVAITDNDVEHV